MITLWPVLAIAELLLSLVAILFSPVLALLARTADSNPYCSAKGPREYLPGWLHLFATHDDGIDAGWYQSLYDDRAPKGWPQKARDGSRLYRWMLRVWWIVRNSGYGFAHFTLGFERVGAYATRILAQRGVWDSDTTNWLVRVDANAAGQRAFQLRAQLYYPNMLPALPQRLSKVELRLREFGRGRYLRLNLGWKLAWTGEQVQIATHINPFRKWGG